VKRQRGKGDGGVEEKEERGKDGMDGTGI